MASYIAKDNRGWRFLPDGSYSATALDHESLRGPCHWYVAYSNPKGLCPVCGERVAIIGDTTDGRLIGSCHDAFSGDKFADEKHTDPR